MSRFAGYLVSGLISAALALWLQSCTGSADAAPSAPSGVTPIAPSYVDNVNGVVCYWPAPGEFSCVKVR